MRWNISLIGGLLAILICLMGLTGLYFDITFFSSILPGYKSISIGTSLIWITLASVLVVYKSSIFPDRVLLSLRIITIIIAIYNLIDCVFDLFGRETLYEEITISALQPFFAQTLTPISPITSCILVLASISIYTLLTSRTTGAKTNQYLAVTGIIGCIISTISFTVIISYIYGSPLLYNSVIIPISAPSGLAAFLMGISMIFASGKDQFPLCFITGSSVRATLLRTFIPLTTFAILLFSILQSLVFPFFAEQSALFVSSFLVSYLIITSYLVSHLSSDISSRIESADRERMKTIEKLRLTYDQLAVSEEELRSNLEELMQKDDELQHTLRDLTESEDKYRSLFNTMKEGVVLHEVLYDTHNHPVDYRILDGNPAFEIHTGLSLEKAKGQIASDFYQVTPAPYCDKYFRVAETGIPDYFETYFEPLKKYFSISVFSPRRGSFATIFTDITERKNADTQMQTMNEILSQAQRIAHVGSWTYVPATNQVLWSDELYRIFGYEPGKMDVTIENIRSHIHPDDLQIHDTILQQAVESQVYISAEYRLFRPDQTLHYVSALGTVEIDDQGNVSRLIGVVQDITERKNTENELIRVNEELNQKNESLATSYEEITASEEEIRSQNEELKISEERTREREEHFILAQQVGKTGSFEIITETGIILGSKELFRIFGLPMNNTGILSVETLQPCIPSYRYLQEEYRSLISSGKPFDQEFTIHPADESEPHVVKTLARLIKDSSGVPIRVIGVIHDITSEYQAKQHLRETRDFLQNLITYANTPIIVWTPSLRVTEFNNAFEKLTGFSRDDIIGSSISRLFPDESGSQSLNLIRSMMHGERWESVTLPVIRSDGTLRTVIWNSAHISDQEGNLQAIVAQGIDITEQEILKREKKIAVEQINRNLAELAILNDAIRNPLTVILTYASTLEPVLAEQIEEEISRIDQMITQLDIRWAESEKIIEFLRRHYQIDIVS